MIFRAYRVMRAGGASPRASLAFALHRIIDQIDDNDGRWPGADVDVIEGGRRCGIERVSNVRGLEDWWIGYSPRNGRGAQVEGPWVDWVLLAHSIIARDRGERRDEGMETESRRMP